MKSAPDRIVAAGMTARVLTAALAGAAVAQIGNIDRATCRAHARGRFGADRMVDDYLRIYRELLS